MTYRFQNVKSDASISAVVNQFNQKMAILDKEAVIKQFRGNDGETLTLGKTGDQTLGMSMTQGEKVAMQVGKYNATRYGVVGYDVNGVPTQLLGQAPDDGRQGHWITPAGVNVLTKLGG